MKAEVVKGLVTVKHGELTPGTTVDLPADTVARLEKAGYLKTVAPPPPPASGRKK